MLTTWSCTPIQLINLLLLLLLHINVKERRKKSVTIVIKQTDMKPIKMQFLVITLPPNPSWLLASDKMIACALFVFVTTDDVCRQSIIYIWLAEWPTPLPSPLVLPRQEHANSTLSSHFHHHPRSPPPHYTTFSYLFPKDLQQMLSVYQVA